MTPTSLEEIDLIALTDRLREELGDTLGEGYLDGRTILRDAVARDLGCSDYEAEELVDTLEMGGYIRFPKLRDETHSDRSALWHIGA